MKKPLFIRKMKAKHLIDTKRVYDHNKSLQHPINDAYPHLNVNNNLTDHYQELFNFFHREHNLILTLSEMQEIIFECKKLNNSQDEYK